MRRDTIMSSFAAGNLDFSSWLEPESFVRCFKSELRCSLSVLIFELLRLAEEMKLLPLSTSRRY
jgi:hypothetical protein